VVGNPVIDIQGGRSVGRVEDLYLDEDLRHVTGIHLGGEGLIRRIPIFIQRHGIAVLGLDVVLVKTAATVSRGEEIPSSRRWVRLHHLQGREMDTPGGTKIGRARDVLLDAEGNVMGLSLGQISVEGPVAQSKTVARSAVVDVDRTDGTLTVDLAAAEREPVEVDPHSLTFRHPAEGR
jgi:sporulation protein YlmC with PRC-barrel domain